MTLSFDAIREYCLRKHGEITEGFPFDEETLVFKVHGKIFLLMDINERPIRLNLKCDPVRAVELRERHEAVQPGYHMDKRHWITVEIDGSIPSRDILGMIDHSHEEVVKGLRKNLRDSLLKKMGK